MLWSALDAHDMTLRWPRGAGSNGLPQIIIQIILCTDYQPLEKLYIYSVQTTFIRSHRYGPCTIDFSSDPGISANSTWVSTWCSPVEQLPSMKGELSTPGPHISQCWMKYSQLPQHWAMAVRAQYHIVLFMVCKMQWLYSMLLRPVEYQLKLGKGA